jgi:hypothetical protein
MSLRFKLSPELADGDHWTVCDTLDQLFEAIKSWHENEPMEGDDFCVEIVDMTDEEIAALPEI